MLLLAFVVFAVIPSTAQEKEIEKSDQQWFALEHHSKFKNNWIWSIDAGYRWRNGFDESMLYYARTSSIQLTRENNQCQDN